MLKRQLYSKAKENRKIYAEKPEKFDTKICKKWAKCLQIVKNYIQTVNKFDILCHVTQKNIKLTFLSQKTNTSADRRKQPMGQPNKVFYNKHLQKVINYLAKSTKNEYRSDNKQNCQFLS